MTIAKNVLFLQFESNMKEQEYIPDWWVNENGGSYGTQR